MARTSNKTVNENSSVAENTATTTNTAKKPVGRKPATKPVVAEKKYNADDLIPCRSMTKGELILIGKKTKETYHWADYGDITEVEYQDLYSLKASKSSFIYNTLFIIDDEELINSPKWKDVKAIYNKIYSDDVDKILEASNTIFRREFAKLPEGLKNAVITEVATRIEKGSFDSIQKVKIIDELCKTDLTSML